MTDPVEAFWTRVAETNDDGECWPWTGPLSEGYGRVTREGRTIGAHRMAYELTVGPIPDGLQIDHLCRNRACCNPSHMEPVTVSENTLRGQGPTAINATKTHCKRGHAFTEANTKIVVRDDHVGRSCRTCIRANARVIWAQQHGVAS